MSEDAWDRALGDYWDEHEEMLVDADARGPAMLSIVPRGRVWEVVQTIHDPAGNHDWRLEATVDLDACDEAGELILHITALRRL